MAEAQAAARVDARRWFYHWMALTCLVIAVLGFMPTFFLPVALGTFAREPMVVLHGLLFFAWITYFAAQTWLAASGRVLAHREWGLLGVAIATAMFFSVMTVAIVRMNQPIGRPAPLVWADVSSMIYFETCIVVALANVRQPEIHKRLMLLATISPLGAAVGRWCVILLGPPSFVTGAPPDFVRDDLLWQAPNVSVVLLISIAMVFDWRTRRHVSRVYAIGLPAFLAMAYSGGLVGASPAWVAVVDWLKRMGG